MRFRVLGPLEVTAPGTGGAALAPRAAKIRVVLAALLVRANETVSVDGLIDELWGEHPPRTAMTTLQVYVSQLRKLLHEADPEYGRDSLVTRAPGYLLRVDPAQLDLAAFEELHQRGREAMQRGDHAAAADFQQRALALWRGPLLSDTPHGPLLDSTAGRLAELRTSALEQRVRAELWLGRHQDLVGELQEITAELPMREEFHAHLMVALYRCGRQADALRVFARVRRALVDELAIEPGRPLQQLHRRILTGDTALLRPPGLAAGAEPGTASGAGADASAAHHADAGGPGRPHASAAGREAAPHAHSAAGPHTAPPPAPTGSAVPSAPAAEPAAGTRGHGAGVRAGVGAGAGALLAAQTPPAPPAGFTGREEELDELSALLRTLPAGGAVVLTGAAGTGKTALALAAADRLAPLFPDGRVFLDLEGPDPKSSAADLVRLLRACGAEGPLPAHEAALRELLDGITRGRRMLFVLDGAADADRVRPLLPATAGSAALLTARREPEGLTGRVLTLREPAPREAGQLFLAAAGRPADAADEAAVRELAALCGRLPLALRAAAELLAAHPHWTPRTLAARLREESGRLAELGRVERDFTARLRAPYEAAGEPERAAFRLLGLLPAGPFTARAAAAVLDLAPQAARTVLAGLERERLAEPEAVPDEPEEHWRLSEPLRLLAAQELSAHTPPDRTLAATVRLAQAYAQDLRRLTAEPSEERRLERFTRREAALLAVVRTAHRAGLWAQTVELATAMTPFVEARASWEVWEAGHALALEAAQRLGDLAAEARLLRSLGDLAWQRRRLSAAGDYYEQALLTADAAPAAAERGRALVGLADLQLDAGAVEGAAALLSPALDAVADDPRGTWEARRVLALVALETHGPSAARPHFTACLDLATTLGDPRLHSYAHRWLTRLTTPTPTACREIRPGIWRTTPAA
ncbi:AfsR/SARP family transcriptional regulator [Streptomyces sp. NPDC046866]|uniref:AfsR/SARP family transcriptional regulator n=1 Tax=Streptomyces sp. NPDC046866 TaxID=3154921 RepID=UPI003451DE5E